MPNELVLGQAHIDVVRVHRKEFSDDLLRTGFRIELQLETQAWPIGATITIAASVIYSPAMTWSQTEQAIADRTAEVLDAVRGLTPSLIRAAISAGLDPIYDQPRARPSADQ